MSYNKTILMGNLTRDPELRYTPKGTAVCELGIAMNRRWKPEGSTEYIDEVTFVDVTFWARKAEVIAENFGKGGSILIEGRLQTDSWDDRETGKKHSKLRVIGETFEFAGDAKKK